MAPPNFCPGPKEDLDYLETLFQETAASIAAQKQFAKDHAAQVMAGVLVDAAKELIGAIPFVGQQILHPIELPPKGATQAEQYEHYKAMLEARGYSLAADKPTVVALRGVASTGDSHATTAALKYDDTMVVISKDAKGEPHVTTFSGSTHPGESNAAIGGTVGVPDVDKDGKADVGMINAGEYELVKHAINDGNHNGATAWDVRTLAGSGALPGVRDTNHDGVYSDAERAASLARGDVLTGVMIHQGAANVPQSAGCLNLSNKDAVYPEFVKAAGGAGNSMKLVILDGGKS
jgi:hypothetical protein